MMELHKHTIFTDSVVKILSTIHFIESDAF